MVFTNNAQDRQRDAVERISYGGFHQVLQPPFFLPQRVFSPQQCPADHDVTVPTLGRYRFPRNCLVAPNKAVAGFGHPPEKILVLSARAKLRMERLWITLNNRPPKKHVSRSAFGPAKLKSCRVPGSMIKPSRA